MTSSPFALSFEFYPPKSEDGIAHLVEQHRLLVPYRPQFFSITYGAGGSTRDRTQNLALKFNGRDGIPAVPHLSCIGDTRESLKQLLDSYQAAGIDRIVALRGDLPQDASNTADEFHYANELVEFIKAHYGEAFDIIVAAYPEVHPEAGCAQKDLDNFQRKVEAGATAAITQYFYNPDAYEDFVERCQERGITIPIYPGIMPITNHDRLVRFSQRCGAEIPRWIEQRLMDYRHDPASLREFGTEVVVRVCERIKLLGAPGFHFYILNQAQSTIDILETLGFAKD